MNTATIVILALIGLIVGGGGAFTWFLISDAAIRRKHYQITITRTPGGDLGVYTSKIVAMGKRPIVVVPYLDIPIASIDVRLSDGKAGVADLSGVPVVHRKDTK